MDIAKIENGFYSNTLDCGDDCGAKFHFNLLITSEDNKRYKLNFEVTDNLLYLNGMNWNVLNGEWYPLIGIKIGKKSFVRELDSEVTMCSGIRMSNIKDFTETFAMNEPLPNEMTIFFNFKDEFNHNIVETYQYPATYNLTLCNQAPTISDYDHYLGEKNSAFKIDYTVWDDDNDKLSVTQRLNYDTIGTYSNVASGTSSTIYITDDMLKKIPLNQKQYIYIIVDDGKRGKTTRTLSFTRTNSVPSISGYDMDLGDKNVGFSINYIVSDSDNDDFTITETLNGQTLRNIPNVQGNASETIRISNEKLYNAPLNQKSTIVITADDGKGGISKRTYTFTRTNTPVAIGIIKKAYPTITFRCTDSNPNGYVTRADIYINNNYITAFTSGFDRELSYNIDFSYLNEGNNTLMIRATNNQNITSDKILNIHKKSLKEPEIGTNIIVKGKKYQIINKKNDGASMSLTLNKPLQNDVSTTDRIEILNDYCKVFARTDENNNYEEMQFIKCKDLGNGYTQERYQLDMIGRKVTTRVNMYGNTSIKQIKEAFQYLED